MRKADSEPRREVRERERAHRDTSERQVPIWISVSGQSGEREGEREKEGKRGRKEDTASRNVQQTEREKESCISHADQERIERADERESSGRDERRGERETSVTRRTRA